MNRLLCAVLSLMAGVLLGAERLNLAFTGEQQLELGGRKVDVKGRFAEGGYLAIGEDGLSLPAASLVGKNQGSIFFGFRLSEMQPPLNIQRSLLALRTGSRFTLGFYYYKDRSLQFSFSDREKSYIFGFDKKLEYGQDYNVGCTWDGSVIRVFLEGRMIAEAVQPLPVPDKIRNLNLGPYTDGWVAPKRWANDTFVKYLRIYDTALTVQEAAELAGVSFVEQEKSTPPMLTIPAVNCSKLKVDGKLDEQAWSYAASMPRLLDVNFPEKSGAIPPHSFKLMYDAEKLYLGFTSLFPAGSQLREGNMRTAEDEPAVWGDESFEFYFRYGGDTYHFLGNVAGGTMERKNRDASWNGAWRYVGSKGVQIDDSILWQGEAEIPWSTLGLKGAPVDDIEFNFCRSWKLADSGADSSLLHVSSYAPESGLVKARFAGEAAALQVHKQNDPNTGEYSHKYSIASERGGNVEYGIALGRLDGSCVPMVAFNKKYSLKAGDVLTDEQQVKIETAGFDCLIYTLTGKSGVLMRELVPFKLNEEYFAVTPYYLRGYVQVLLKQQMMKSKLGADFAGNLVLLSPEGKELARFAASENESRLPFDYLKMPAGAYRLELQDGAGKAVSSIELSYPGLGDWARQDFNPERIIPPFIEMSYKQSQGGLEVSPARRTYIWEKSYLPKQILAEGQRLFAEPARVLLGGKEVGATEFSVLMAKPHRAEFQALGSQMKVSSWIEYDGVQWNEVLLTPERDVNGLDLQFTLPAAVAKYMHGTYCGSWGSKITKEVAEGTTNLAWMPILWLGDEEKGLCFFAEERNDWSSSMAQTYTIEKRGDKAVWSVHIASKLAAKRPFTFKFGLVATPVRPQPELPLDTLGWDYTAPLNRPGRRPTLIVTYLKSISDGDLGNFFGDMDNPEAAKTRNAYKRMLAGVKEQPQLRTMTYTAAKYLSVKYPEVAAFLPDWTLKPEVAMDYQHTGHFVYECCPSTMASDFIVWKIKDHIRRNPGIGGVYFDFGTLSPCSNAAHGCRNRVAILAYREYFRRIALAQLEAGIEHPTLAVHNTDYVMIPCYTFVTNLMNGEQIRQDSSSILHNKKDVIDSMPFANFATELSSMAFGITNSVYFPVDKLAAKYGGDEEDAPYKFRMGKANFAVTLPHNTIPDQMRNHYGLYDKLVRIYDEFGVTKSRFVGYWKGAVTVTGGDRVLVSCYVNQESGHLLAVIGHAGKSHAGQDFSVAFDWKRLGINKRLSQATERMSADDPEYAWLFEQRGKRHVPQSRAPLDLGDFGSKVVGFDGEVLKMHLDYHCFAIVELK